MALISILSSLSHETNRKKKRKVFVVFEIIALDHQGVIFCSTPRKWGSASLFW